MSNRKKLTIKEFSSRATIIHNNKYDYSKVIYINNRLKIEILCTIHGSFWQTPSNHLVGKGCKQCAINSSRSNNENFIKLANTIHNNKYDYSKIEYVDCKSIIKIICPIHGKFYQTPENHLRTHGCYGCGKNSFNLLKANDTSYFIEKSNIIHNNKYDYSKTVYVRNRDKVIIICPIHKEFKQMAMHHLEGKGCKICAMSASNKESKWLDMLGISKENRNKVIFINKNTWIKPDGYDPITNTIYEFYGDYWHGNPKVYNLNDVNKNNGKTFGELYLNTLNREIMITNAGYTLFAVWQYDLENKEAA